MKRWLTQEGKTIGNPQLVALQIVIRHGDRSSIHWLTPEPAPFSCAFTDDDAIKVKPSYEASEIMWSSKRKAVPGCVFSHSYVGFVQAVDRFERYEVKGARSAVLEPQVVHSEDAIHERCFAGQLTERGFLQHLHTGR
jgi:hypothetical protein